MTEYAHTLTTTAELKRINLQNMQMAIRLRDLEAENKALKDKLAEYALRNAYSEPSYLHLYQTSKPE